MKSYSDPEESDTVSVSALLSFLSTASRASLDVSSPSLSLSGMEFAGIVLAFAEYSWLRSDGGRERESTNSSSDESVK